MKSKTEGSKNSSAWFLAITLGDLSSNITGHMGEVMVHNLPLSS